MKPESLIALQQSLRDILSKDGISQVLSQLKKTLPENTEKYNIVFQLEARLNATNKDKLKGVLSQEDLDLAYNRLRSDILDFINALDLEDFEPPVEVNKNGSILYQIPHTMEFGDDQEYRCIVRLAYTDEVVVENVDLTQDTVVKPVRVSEVMEVELKDPDETSPGFSIKRINSPEQFLEKQTYTEWLFYVKPLKTGRLPLLLVVSVKELIQNKERRKEIVLEEIIQVVTEHVGAVETTAELKDSGYSFSYTVSPEIEQQPDKRKGAWFPSKYKSLAAVALMVVMIGGLWATGAYLGLFSPDYYPSNPDDKKNPDHGDTVYHQNTPNNDTIINSDTSTVQKEDSTILVNATDTVKKVDAKKPPKPSSPKKSSNKNNTGKDKAVKEEEAKPLAPAQKSGFTMIKVKGGSFTLGAHYGSDNCKLDKINLRDFYIGQYEITQADWKSIMGANPSFKNSCALCPVENVSFSAVLDFIAKAGQIKGKKYRLPSEAEWEYAARGGNESQNYKYAGSNISNKVAWFSTVNDHSHEVGLKKANEIGIFDMSGNISEWCWPTLPSYIKCSNAKDLDKQKYLRGGAWRNVEQRVEITYRNRYLSNKGQNDIGFRLVEEK